MTTPKPPGKAVLERVVGVDATVEVEHLRRKVGQLEAEAVRLRKAVGVSAGQIAGHAPGQCPTFSCPEGGRMSETDGLERAVMRGTRKARACNVIHRLCARGGHEATEVRAWMRERLDTTKELNEGIESLLDFDDAYTALGLDTKEDA